MSAGELADLAERVATAAARMAQERKLALDPTTKSSPTDVVTAMDKAVEHFIVGEILAARPHDAIVGEEGDRIDGSSGIRWLIDPIDGTVNYLYRYGRYAVSIAAEPDDDSPAGSSAIAGVVADISAGRMFRAVRGGGATLDGEPIQVNPVTDLSLALIATGFSYDAAARVAQGRIVAELLDRVRDIRRAGSAALDLCDVACGALDGYYERGLNPWDYAAGALIAAEAGAVVGGVAGPQFGPEMTIAAAPGIVAALRAAVGGLQTPGES